MCRGARANGIFCCARPHPSHAGHGLSCPFGFRRGAGKPIQSLAAGTSVVGPMALVSHCLSMVLYIL